MRNNRNMPSPTTRHLIKNVWLFNDLEDDNKKCRESQSKTVQLDDSAHASPSSNSRVSNPHAKIPKKERKKEENPPFRMRKEGSRHRRSTSSSQTRKYPPTPILFHSILFCNSTFSPLLFCLCRYSFSLPSTLCIRSTPPFLNVRLLTDCVGGASSLVIVVVPQDSRIFIFPSV